jgi:hypothetical protein
VTDGRPSITPVYGRPDALRKRVWRKASALGTLPASVSTVGVGAGLYLCEPQVMDTRPLCETGRSPPHPVVCWARTDLRC